MGPLTPRKRENYMQLQTAAKPPVLRCHLANTNEESGGLVTAIPPFAKLLWSFFIANELNGQLHKSKWQFGSVQSLRTLLIIARNIEILGWRLKSGIWWLGLVKLLAEYSNNRLLGWHSPRVGLKQHMVHVLGPACWMDVPVLRHVVTSVVRCLSCQRRTTQIA